MFQDFLQQNFLGNRIMDYLITVVAILVGIIFIKLFRCFLLARLKKWAESSSTSVDDFLIKILQGVFLPLAYFGIVFLSIQALQLTPSTKKILETIWTGILALFAARLATQLIDYSFKLYLRKSGKNVALERSMNGILRVVSVIIWGLAIVFFLDNLGFKVTAVITGLGIGGIAVALAAQAVLGDLFSYFAILFDRPFEIGDFIIIGDYMGCVEHIGIKTTRISSLGGEQLIFANTDLTNSRVRNYKRMKKRRVVFKLGVTYQATLEQVKEIPGLIEGIIKGVEETTFDRAHFFSYGDFSLIFEVVYYVNGGDYNKYMDIQQEINFAVKKEFEDRGIEFAYPTQTLFVPELQKEK